MRPALNILAIIAVLLSGISTTDLRDVAGSFHGTSQLEAVASFNDAPPVPADVETENDDGTSDCTTTSVYLMTSQATVFLRGSPPCFSHRRDRVEGAQPLPLKQPPRFVG